MGKSGLKGLVTKLSKGHKPSAEANSGLTKYLKEASSNYGKFSDTPSVVPSVVEGEEENKEEAPPKRASVACDGRDLVDPLASKTIHIVERNRRSSHGDRARRRAVRRSKSGVSGVTPDQVEANTGTISSNVRGTPRRTKSTLTGEGSNEIGDQPNSRRGKKRIPKRCKSDDPPSTQEGSSEAVDQPNSRMGKKLPPKRCKSDTTGTQQSAPGPMSSSSKHLSSSSSKHLSSSSKHSLGARRGRRRRSTETEARTLISSSAHVRLRASEKDVPSLGRSVHGRSKVKRLGSVGCDGTGVGPGINEKKTSNVTRDSTKKRVRVKKSKGNDNDVSHSSRGSTRRRKPAATTIKLEDVFQEPKLISEEANNTSVPVVPVDLATTGLPPWSPPMGEALSQTKVQMHKKTTQEFDLSSEHFETMCNSNTPRPTTARESQDDDVSEDGDSSAFAIDFSEDGDSSAFAIDFSEDGDSSAFAIDVDESDYDDDSEYDASSGDLYDGPVPLVDARRANMSSYGRHNMDHGSVAIDLGYGDPLAGTLDDTKTQVLVQSSLEYEQVQHLEYGDEQLVGKPCANEDDISVTRQTRNSAVKAPQENTHRNRRASMGSYHCRTATTDTEPVVDNKIAATLKETNVRKISPALVPDNLSAFKLAFDDKPCASFISETKHGIATETQDKTLFPCQMTDMIAAANKTSLRHRSSSMRFLNATNESATMMHEPHKQDVRKQGEHDSKGTSKPRQRMPRRAASVRVLSAADESTIMHEPLKQDEKGMARQEGYLEPVIFERRSNPKLPFDDASTLASFAMSSVSTGTRRASIGF